MLVWVCLSLLEGVAYLLLWVVRAYLLLFGGSGVFVSVGGTGVFVGVGVGAAGVFVLVGPAGTGVFVSVAVGGTGVLVFVLVGGDSMDNGDRNPVKSISAEPTCGNKPIEMAVKMNSRNNRVLREMFLNRLYNDGEVVTFMF